MADKATKAQPLLETAFALWWVATVATTGGWMVGGSKTASEMFGGALYSWSALLAGVWFLACYGVGLFFDRAIDGRFSEGYPPFSAPWTLIVWRVFALCGAVVAISETARISLAGGKSAFTAAQWGLTAGLVWLGLLLILGVIADVATARRFSRRLFPFQWNPLVQEIPKEAKPARR